MEECDLRGVRKITEASLTKFVYEARKLKKLDVRGCQGTTTFVSSQFISMYVSSHCILNLDVVVLLSLSLQRILLVNNPAPFFFRREQRGAREYREESYELCFCLLARELAVTRMRTTSIRA